MGAFQGCPLSMIFHRSSLYSLVSLCANISPQLYADDLKCTSYCVDSVLTAAQYTVSFVRAVGQEASPSKCVLLGTSKAVRRRMIAWRNRNEGCFWAVKLDVRDLGGHLDVTLRAVACTLTNRFLIATAQVPAVGALPLGFQRMLGLVRSKHLPGGLHGCEGAAVSVTALAFFFFFQTKLKDKIRLTCSVRCGQTSRRASASTSCTEGKRPPTPGSPRFSNRDTATALAAEHANKLHHLRHHAACALALRMWGADCAFPWDTHCRNVWVSRDHCPPTSPAITTRRALPFDPDSSGYRCSLR